jgi:hypothetical protein
VTLGQKLKIKNFNIKGVFWGFLFQNYVLAQAEPALKNFFFQARAKILSVSVYI